MFPTREIPGGDAAAYVTTSITSIPRRLDALVTAQAPYEHLTASLAWTEHIVVDTDVDSCTIQLRADTLSGLVMAVARLALHAPVHVVEPRALADEVEALVRNLRSYSVPAGVEQ